MFLLLCFELVLLLIDSVNLYYFVMYCNVVVKCVVYCEGRKGFVPFVTGGFQGY